MNIIICDFCGKTVEKIEGHTASVDITTFIKTPTENNPNDFTYEDFSFDICEDCAKQKVEEFKKIAEQYK
jgi:hypothetical protein